ncbi:MAG: glycerol-3-phosphate dehydrogenase [Betaproteobacteria bacterium]|nr:glycerol-3-phosphate dehydrogenase [Betaproteobacteria bacterium]
MNAPANYDLAIIGGGINGAGVAREAAGRGLRVLLAEAGDLGGGTSSASTKLIHGGLRYLEHGELRLVAEALAEREALLKIAPHLVRPLEFVLPYESHLRPAWMLRAGLFLYEHLGTRAWGLGGSRSSLPKSRPVRLEPDGYGAGLKREFRSGFAYYDCSVDDARLVVANARSAKAHGASILTRTPCVAARRERGAWRIVLKGEKGELQASAKALVNAAGPWVEGVLERAIGIGASGNVRLVKGSHIVVPRIHEKTHAYILQNPDARIVFLIPFEREFTLVGTTDVPLPANPSRAEISPEEIAYLCAAASRYTERPITPAQVLWSYSGVRALYGDGTEDPSAITRDYHLQLDFAGPPLVTLVGGKITTYRRLAETVMGKLSRLLPSRGSWTHAEPLPGGDFGGADFDRVLAELQRRYPNFNGEWLARLARRHGTLVPEILGSAREEAELGEDFGGGLFEAEVRYLVANEWAREADDVLWRRTKCALHMSEGQRERFGAYMRQSG